MSVQYATADGTAIAGTNYLATAGTLLFNPGDTSETVSVSTIGQGINEPNRSFTLNLSAAQGATIGRATGTATILNDTPVPLLSIGDATVSEANPTATFVVTLSTPSDQAVSVHYATADGTAIAGTNYVATSGTLTFPAGTTSQAVNVSILNDGIYNNALTLSLNLSNPTNAAFDVASATGTIDNVNPCADGFRRRLLGRSAVVRIDARHRDDQPFGSDAPCR